MITEDEKLKTPEASPNTSTTDSEVRRQGEARADRLTKALLEGLNEEMGKTPPPR